MEVTRRRFLSGAGLACAAALSPGASWAEAGGPAFLAAAKAGEGYRLAGLSAAGGRVFELALPGRGHAAAAHPRRAEAVAFARRPGTFALVLDCAAGRIAARLDAPEGRHFYGHGAFSADGGLLFTTENAVATGEGRLGVWDAAAGYARIGEVASGGIGPHDVALMPGGATLAVANGGIRTHPASGREKLNLDTMRPNLAHLRVADGAPVTLAEPPEALRLASIRHLSVAPDGLVAAALQWQGDPADAVPLLALHRAGWDAPAFLEADPLLLRRMAGYAGSVAFDGEGRRVAITSPRGGLVLAWGRDGRVVGEVVRPDVCGIAPAPGGAPGWIATDGLGGIVAVGAELSARPLGRAGVAWDNHLVPV